MRDNFSEEIKKITAQRVGNRCSNPECRALTSGPQTNPNKALNVGVAAHITAASKGGPRFNPSLSPEKRKSPENAVWLCQTCGKLVDNDEARFTEDLLLKWKHQSETEARLQIGRAITSSNQKDYKFTREELDLLIVAAETGKIFIFSADEMDDCICIGSHYFQDQSDPAIAAAYMDAFHSLKNRGLIKHKGGILFNLTGKGFEIAREIKKLSE